MTEITDRQIDDFYGEYEYPTHKTAEKNKYFLRRKYMEPKKDCFGYRKARCSVLTEMVCRYGFCSFYKTTEQEKADRLKYGFKRNYKNQKNE